MSEGDPPVEPTRPGDWRRPRLDKKWPDEITYLIRFYVAAKGEKLPQCPVCGSRKRGRWTMLCRFQTFSLGQFKIEPGPEQEALTLVCLDHPINPVKEIFDALAL